jgi:hypothetical protein
LFFEFIGSQQRRIPVKKRILILDDNLTCLAFGRQLLEAAGHQVTTHQLDGSEECMFPTLPESLHVLLQQNEVVIVDRDIGAYNTNSLLCMMRDAFPSLPIIRWMRGKEGNPFVAYLKVSVIPKPTKKNAQTFAGLLNCALREQENMQLSPLDIFHRIDDAEPDPDDASVKTRFELLQKLREIAQLSTKPQVMTTLMQLPWSIAGRAGGVTSQVLLHCLCSGSLSPNDIAPCWEDIKIVMEKFKADLPVAVHDPDFERCLHFVREGKLENLELLWDGV